MENRQANQQTEIFDLAVLLADLKSKWPDLYRHIMGLIKTVVRR